MTACLDLAPIASLKDGTIACVTVKSGVKLRAAVFGAKANLMRGTICLFGGRTEFIEKYAEVIEEFRTRGFMVACLDWRGQGGSSRVNANSLKGHIADYAHYDEDLLNFMSEIVKKSCKPPFIAFSHSMGGLILLRSALQRKNYFDKYIFSSPFINIATGGIGATRALANFLNTLGFHENCLPFVPLRASYLEPFLNNKLTSDAKRFNTMEEVGKLRPDLFIGAPTIGWIYQSFLANDEIRNAPASQFIDKPMLFCVAMADKIVSPQATLELATRLPKATIARLEGSEHETYLEKDAIRAKMWAAIDGFI